MKISKIQFSNVRGFKTLDVHLEDEINVLITGNNGNGKTTFLRAMSLAFCDEMGAAGLLSELPGQFITYGEKEALITVDLKNGIGEQIRIVTQVINRFGTEQVRKRYSTWKDGKWIEKTEDDLSKLTEIPHTNLFTVAYGTCLRILGKERYTNYYQADALYSLFKIDTFLQEQELAFRRLLDQAQTKSANKEKIVKREIISLLGNLLNYDGDPNIRLDGTGIFFGRSKKYPSELTTKGDGVRAVTTMVLDLMSWWYLYLTDNELLSDSNYYDAKQVSGIVFIDEVALYLHPEWQKNIVGSFINAFPNVQFIFTTHAPLCVSGATDFDNKIKFLRLRKKDIYTSTTEYSLPKGYGADEILTSEAFGLNTSVSPNIENALKAIETRLTSKETVDAVSTDIEEDNNVNLKNLMELYSKPISPENFAEKLASLGFMAGGQKPVDGLIALSSDNETYLVPDPRDLPWTEWINLRTDMRQYLSTTLIKKNSSETE